MLINPVLLLINTKNGIIITYEINGGARSQKILMKLCLTRCV